jgi:hypothetical protein
MSDDDWQQVYDIHMRGIYKVRVESRQGCVIRLTSIATTGDQSGLAVDAEPKVRPDRYHEQPFGSLWQLWTG